MYIVIVGAGDIGTPEIATEGGNGVVVIERDETRAERAATTPGTWACSSASASTRWRTHSGSSRSTSTAA